MSMPNCLVFSGLGYLTLEKCLIVFVHVTGEREEDSLTVANIMYVKLIFER